MGFFKKKSLGDSRFDTDTIVVNSNDEIQGHTLINAFGNPQTFPSTVVTDDGDLVVNND